MCATRAKQSRCSHLQYRNLVHTNENSDALATISMIPPVVFAESTRISNRSLKDHFSVDHHTYKKSIYNRYCSSLCWCKDTTVDSAKDDNRHQESPECIFEGSPALFCRCFLALDGLISCLFASRSTTITSATPIRIPGTIPAINISPMETPVMDAYTTNAILGGMTIAMELAVAINAVENGAEKPPRSTIAGIRTAPKGCYRRRTGTGDRAEEAGNDDTYIRNTAFSVTDAGVNEIGSVCVEIPAFAIIFPDNTKNGIARSRNLLIPEYIFVATIVK